MTTKPANLPPAPVRLYTVNAITSGVDAQENLAPVAFGTALFAETPYQAAVKFLAHTWSVENDILAVRVSWQPSQTEASLVAENVKQSLGEMAQSGVPMTKEMLEGMAAQVGTRVKVYRGEDLDELLGDARGTNLKMSAYVCLLSVDLPTRQHTTWANTREEAAFLAFTEAVAQNPKLQINSVAVSDPTKPAQEQQDAIQIVSRERLMEMLTEHRTRGKEPVPTAGAAPHLTLVGSAEEAKKSGRVIAPLPSGSRFDSVNKPKDPSV